MNRFTLHKAGISISEGMQRLKLDKLSFESLLISFIDNENFMLLCQAIDEKNVSSAFLHAHSLKGISANLSLTKLHLAISPVADILKNDSFENVEELMPLVKEAFELVIATLQMESKKT